MFVCFKNKLTLMVVTQPWIRGHYLYYLILELLAFWEVKWGISHFVFILKTGSTPCWRHLGF